MKARMIVVVLVIIAVAGYGIGEATGSWLGYWTGHAAGVAIAVAGAVTVLAVLVLLRGRRAVEDAADDAGRERSETIERSPVEVALTWSVWIGSGLLLGRALLELLKGLAELPGASEHWAGDVTAWLVLVLPIPIMIGMAGLLSAGWLSGHAIGPRRAAVGWLALVIFALSWISLVVASAAAQGNYIRPFDDPLLWPPCAAVIGAISGVVLLVAILVRRRVARPTG
jgi:hypothetical protein